MGRRKRGRPPKREITIKSKETKTFFGLLLIILGLMAGMSFYLEGSVFELVREYVGIGAIPLGFTMILLGSYVLGYDWKMNQPVQIIGMAIIALLFSTIAHFIIPEEDAKFEAFRGQGGGLLGYNSSMFMVDTFGRIASVVVFSLTGLISLSMVTGSSIIQMKEFLESLFKKVGGTFEKKPSFEDATEPEAQFVGNQIKVKDSEEDTRPESKEHSTTDIQQIPMPNISNGNSEESMKEEEIVKYPKWMVPATNILAVSEPVKQNPEVHKKNAKIIEDTLKSFKIM
ncbi:MAG: DNA translocase FtsK 4TM domain-containing protein, partial [bacterium]